VAAEDKTQAQMANAEELKDGDLSGDQYIFSVQNSKESGKADVLALNLNTLKYSMKVASLNGSHSRLDEELYYI
jgi:hypothetical protein